MKPPPFLPSPSGGGPHRRLAAAAGGRQLPNRFTRYFQAAKRACPDQIRAYARCVAEANEESGLSRGCCQQEFDGVKECFRNARRSSPPPP